MGNIDGTGRFEVGSQQCGRRLIVITEFIHDCRSRGRGPDTTRIHDATFQQEFVKEDLPLRHRANCQVGVEEVGQLVAITNSWPAGGNHFSDEFWVEGVALR